MTDNSSTEKPLPSACNYLEQLNKKEISSAELVEQTLDRIHSVNDKLNAVVAENPEQSIAEAKQADARRQQGQTLPLLGLPITIKDSIDVEGFTCTGGSFARENYKPKDSTVAARLRAAGAILIAKTNCPEYSSSYETDNAIFGRTNHPGNLEHTPGGSTGGEAALLAADATLVGIGLDGGGSIRVPSHYCGTVGIRPTVGRVPDTGSWPETRDTGYRDLMCIGPMARYVEDLSLILPIISGPDWKDPYATPAPLGSPDEVEIRNLRVGYYDSDGTIEVTDETKSAVAAAVKALEAKGASVSEVKLPDVSDATMIFFSMAGADGGKRTWKDLEGCNGRHHEQFQSLLDGFGEPLPLADFFDLQGRFFLFRAMMREFINDYDVIICPVTTGPSPKHMTPPFGVPQEEYLQYAAFNYVHAWAVAGVPVSVVKAGEENGFPLGVQIVSQAFNEHISLAAASTIEKNLGAFTPLTGGLV
jgi:Asp-tRNA(Asn)/Glu-tRNA(Gln) amidotransferase A subunit family amidase